MAYFWGKLKVATESVCMCVRDGELFVGRKTSHFSWKLVVVKEQKGINQGWSLREKGYVGTMFNKFKMELDLLKMGGRSKNCLQWLGNHKEIFAS